MPSAVVGSYAALRMRPALYGYTSACVSDGHIFSLAWEKIWKKRTLFCSETAVTYLLKNGTVFSDRSFCLSMNDCRKSPSLLVTAESVLKNL